MNTLQKFIKRDHWMISLFFVFGLLETEQSGINENSEPPLWLSLIGLAIFIFVYVLVSSRCSKTKGTPKPSTEAEHPLLHPFKDPEGFYFVGGLSCVAFALGTLLKSTLFSTGLSIFFPGAFMFFVGIGAILGVRLGKHKIKQFNE